MGDRTITLSDLPNSNDYFEMQERGMAEFSELYDVAAFSETNMNGLETGSDSAVTPRGIPLSGTDIQSKVGLLDSGRIRVESFSRDGQRFLTHESHQYYDGVYHRIKNRNPQDRSPENIEGLRWRWETAGGSDPTWMLDDCKFFLRNNDSKIFWKSVLDGSSESELEVSDVGQVGFDALVAYLQTQSGGRSAAGHQAQVYYDAQISAFYELHRLIADSAVEPVTIEFEDKLFPVGSGDMSDVMVALIRFGWLKEASQINIATGEVVFGTKSAALSALNKIFRKDAGRFDDASSASLAYYIHGQNTSTYNDDVFIRADWAWATYANLSGAGVSGAEPGYLDNLTRPNTDPQVEGSTTAPSQTVPVTLGDFATEVEDMRELGVLPETFVYYTIVKDGDDVKVIRFETQGDRGPVPITDYDQILRAQIPVGMTIPTGAEIQAALNRPATLGSLPGGLVANADSNYLFKTRSTTGQEILLIRAPVFNSVGTTGQIVMNSENEFGNASAQDQVVQLTFDEVMVLNRFFRVIDPTGQKLFVSRSPTGDSAVLFNPVTQQYERAYSYRFSFTKDDAKSVIVELVKQLKANGYPVDFEAGASEAEIIAAAESFFTDGNFDYWRPGHDSWAPFWNTYTDYDDQDSWENPQGLSGSVQFGNDEISLRRAGLMVKVLLDYRNDVEDFGLTSAEQREWQESLANRQLTTSLAASAVIAVLSTVLVVWLQKRAQDGNTDLNKSSGDGALDNISTNIRGREDQILDRIKGREEEARSIFSIMSVEGQKNSVLLTGDPGIGKTTIIEYLAAAINNRREDLGVTPALYGAEILSLDVNSLVAGTAFRGQFEQKINNVIKRLKEMGGLEQNAGWLAEKIGSGLLRKLGEVGYGELTAWEKTKVFLAFRSYKNELPNTIMAKAELARREGRKIILFIDEIHAALNIGGSAERGANFLQFLKPYLADGTITVIGATTDHEKHLLQGLSEADKKLSRNQHKIATASNDPALADRFTEVNMKEPPHDVVIAITRGAMKSQWTAQTRRDPLLSGIDIQTPDSILETIYERGPDYSKIGGRPRSTSALGAQYVVDVVQNFIKGTGQIRAYLRSQLESVSPNSPQATQILSQYYQQLVSQGVLVNLGNGRFGLNLQQADFDRYISGRPLTALFSIQSSIIHTVEDIAKNKGLPIRFDRLDFARPTGLGLEQEISRFERIQTVVAAITDAISGYNHMMPSRHREYFVSLLNEIMNSSSLNALGADGGKQLLKFLKSYGVDENTLSQIERSIQIEMNTKFESEFDTQSSQDFVAYLSQLEDESLSAEQRQQVRELKKKLFNIYKPKIISTDSQSGKDVFETRVQKSARVKSTDAFLEIYLNELNKLNFETDAVKIFQKLAELQAFDNLVSKNFIIHMAELEEKSLSVEQRQQVRELKKKLFNIYKPKIISTDSQSGKDVFETSEERNKRIEKAEKLLRKYLKELKKLNFETNAAKIFQKLTNLNIELDDDNHPSLSEGAGPPPPPNNNDEIPAHQQTSNTENSEAPTEQPTGERSNVVHLPQGPRPEPVNDPDERDEDAVDDIEDDNDVDLELDDPVEDADEVREQLQTAYDASKQKIDSWARRYGLAQNIRDYIDQKLSEALASGNVEDTREWRNEFLNQVLEGRDADATIKLEYAAHKARKQAEAAVTRAAAAPTPAPTRPPAPAAVTRPAATPTPEVDQSRLGYSDLDEEDDVIDEIESDEYNTSDVSDVAPVVAPRSAQQAFSEFVALLTQYNSARTAADKQVLASTIETFLKSEENSQSPVVGFYSLQAIYVETYLRTHYPRLSPSDLQKIKADVAIKMALKATSDRSNNLTTNWASDIVTVARSEMERLAPALAQYGSQTRAPNASNAASYFDSVVTTTNTNRRR